MKTRFLLCLCLLVTTLLVRANAHNSRFYSISEVGYQSFEAFCQDAHRFIWMATEYGLRRFDGTEFVNYFHNPQDSTSLADNNVRTLFVDREQRLWVGTANGLQRYLPCIDSFETVSLHQRAFGGYITDIIQRADGDILFNVSGLGVFRLDTQEMKGYPLEMKNEHCHPRYLTNLYEDSQHRLWIGTDRQGIVRLDPANGEEKFFPLPDNSTKRILEDTDGQLYTMTSHAIYRLDRTTEHFQPLPYRGDKRSYYLNRALLTSKGDIVLSTMGHGLMIVRKGEQEMTDLNTIRNSFVDVNRSKVTSIFEDGQQNLWVACKTQGILMQPRQPMPFRFWSKTQFPTDTPGNINTLLCARDGTLWFTIENNGIYQADPQGNLLRHIPTRHVILSLYEDSDGRLWAGANGQGLYVVNPGNATLRLVHPVGKDYAMRGITEDRNKNLYVAVMGEGILRYHLPTGEKSLINYQSDIKGRKNLVNFWVFTICIDSQGRIWLGHYGGLSCYDPKERGFVQLNIGIPVRQNAFYTVFEGRDHRLWMGTSNGLYGYDPASGSSVSFTTADGLPDNVICGVVEDKNGDLWCSTAKGISRVTPATRKVSNFYTGNGLEDKSYLEGQCAIDPATDAIYFSGYQGITSFRPDHIRPNASIPPPVVTGMYLRNQRVNTQTLSGGRPILEKDLTETDRIRLSYEDNTFALTLSTMEYKDTRNTFYEYRLREFGDPWSKTLPGENRIRYHHLPAGSYHLEMRACENDLHSSTKVIHIDIAAPWFASPLAKTVYVLMALGVGYLMFITIRRKQRENISEAKLQFFINIAHEIRSPLTLIVNPLESMLRRTHDPEEQEQLNTIHRNARRILTLLNQLLDIRKIDKGQMYIHCTETDMNDFIARQMDFFKSQAKQKNIRLQLTASPGLPHVWIDPKYFDKVLMNLLSNAFKYTPDGGEISIHIGTGTDEQETSPLRNYLEIVVADTGKGLNEKELKKIFDRFYQSHDDQASSAIGFGIGLNLCYSLVKLHHGSISAANRQDSPGSQFIIRLPLGNKHLKQTELRATSDELQATSDKLRATSDKLQTTSDGEGLTPSVSAADNTEPTKGKKPKTNHRVLVIDDDEELRDYLKNNLAATYRIDTAADGTSGWKKVIATQPSVVISDVMMPGIDGFRLVKTLKANPNTAHIPIILLTSKTEFANRIEGLTQGADAYLAKPFNLEELTAIIANLIDNRIRLKGKYSGNQEQDGKITPVEVQSNDEALMDRIMKILDTHLNDSKMNVEMLAQEAGVSRTQLHRRIKDITGLSPSDFIRNIRLKQAAKLLKERRLNVTEVAYSVGFTSQAHFSTAFKKAYGVAPTEYAETEGGKDINSPT